MAVTAITTNSSAETCDQFKAWQQSHLEDPLGSASDAASYRFEEFCRQDALLTPMPCRVSTKEFRPESYGQVSEIILMAITFM